MRFRILLVFGILALIATMVPASVFAQSTTSPGIDNEPNLAGKSDNRPAH